jgi:hypothetical protein
MEPAQLLVTTTVAIAHILTSEPIAKRSLFALAKTVEHATSSVITTVVIAQNHF